MPRASIASLIIDFLANIGLFLAIEPSELVRAVFGGGPEPKPTFVAVIDVILGSGSWDI